MAKPTKTASTLTPADLAALVLDQYLDPDELHSALLDVLSEDDLVAMENGQGHGNRRPQFGFGGHGQCFTPIAIIGACQMVEKQYDARRGVVAQQIEQKRAHVLI